MEPTATKERVSLQELLRTASSVQLLLQPLAAACVHQRQCQRQVEAATSAEAASVTQKRARSPSGSISDRRRAEEPEADTTPRASLSDLGLSGLDLSGFRGLTLNGFRGIRLYGFHVRSTSHLTPRQVNPAKGLGLQVYIGILTFWLHSRQPPCAWR